MIEERRDKGRLEHILQSIEKSFEYTDGVDCESFGKDSLRLHATMYNVQIIGEAVCKLTKEFKEDHPDTNWRIIEKMRHILVHDYYQIKTEILWDVVKSDLPELKEQIIKYISEFQD
ncbi:MAG: DUF86 domain-containing protein [Paludibacteraceae bacterium]|nr:DUF86 domain-containing protein [Paludibacteraceae bacterium]